MILSLQSFGSFVRTQARVIQATAASTIDLTVGSTLRAVIEAVAGVGLWLQYVALQVLRTTRLASSTGEDVDTFVEDFGLTRLPADPATGLVTFGRHSNGIAAFIPVGTIVKTADGTLSFSVIADSTNSAFSAATNGYNISATTSSIDVPVVSSTVGKGGNILAGSIGLLGSSIPGVDTVTNALNYTNGADAETDTALKARFVGYIASLSKATLAAVQYAITSVQQGLLFTVLENQLPDGTQRYGTFTIVVDDGSGTPSDKLITSVQAAVDAVRPLCSFFSVHPPTVVPVSVQMMITVTTGASKPAAEAAISQAITNYVDGLNIGDQLSYLRLAQIAFDASPTISGVSALTVNGATSDLAGAPTRVYKIASVSVT